MIELTDTNSSQIAAEFVKARTRAGSPAMGMVMTLIIVAPEDDAAEAMLAAKRASREHPSRVLGVILGDARGAAHVNAQVGSGDGWGGETALIRLKGEVVKHAESVVLPLLLPDSPVAIWWPTASPADPATDPLGALAQRRITDSASVSRGKSTAMLTQCESYAPGNTDLSWTRLTPVARAPGRLARPAPAEGHPRQGRRRAGQPERRPARRVAGRAAQGRGGPGQLRGTRHHRGQHGHQGGTDPDLPGRRPAGDLHLPQPPRPTRRAQAPRGPGPALRGAAPARRGRRLRRGRCAAGQAEGHRSERPGRTPPRRRRHAGRRRGLRTARPARVGPGAAARCRRSA